LVLALGVVGRGRSVGRDERDLASVGRPRVIVDAFFRVRQRTRLAAVDREQPDLRVVVAGADRHERDRAAVGRPFRARLALVAERELAWRAAVGGDEPQVTAACWRVAALVPRADGVGDRATVRRYREAAE